MKIIKALILTGFLLTCLRADANAQQAGHSNQALDRKQQSIVVISALTAKGDLVRLPKALGDGLDAGLTVNQIKEALTHLYAYCGFPRSIRGLQTFMSVLDERKAKGIRDELGAEPTPVEDRRSKYERGRDVLGKLTRVPQKVPLTGYSAFAPVIDTFLKEHLFADIFERDVLSYAERELVTIAVLSSIGGVEPMLKSHFNICLITGLTPGQLKQFIGLIGSSVGDQETKPAEAVLNDVLQNSGNTIK